MSTAHPDSQTVGSLKTPIDNESLAKSSPTVEQQVKTQKSNELNQLVDAETVLPTPVSHDSESKSTEDKSVGYSVVNEILDDPGSVDFGNQDEMFSHVDESDMDCSVLEENCDEWIGARVGDSERYEIIGYIGRGGMANVYLGIDHNRNSIEVAIKVPFQRLLSTPSMRERFERESRALVSLEHPNICRVIDTGTFHEIPFVVLQKLGGKNLRERFRSSELPGTESVAERLFAWLQPIATALDFMHSKGYVHRDVKPENILFDENNHAFLGDFGIVRAIKESELPSDSLTRFDSWMGTPGYVAPEVGTEKSLDARCDQYSLACVVYVAMTAKAPFPGKTPTEFRTAQATMDPVPIHELNERIPAQVSAVVEKALERNPANRYPSCCEFLDAMRLAFEASDPKRIIDQQPSLNLSPKLYGRRSLLTVGLAILTFSILGVAVKFGLFEPGHTDAAVQLKEQATEEITETGTPSNPTLSKDPQSATISESREVEQPLTETVEVNDSSESERSESSSDTHVRTINSRQELAMIDYENALTYLENGEHQAALDSLNHAIEYDGNHSEFFATRGIALIKLDQNEAALEQFDTAFQLAEDIPDLVLASWYSGRAAAHARSQDFDSAITDVSTAIDLNPQDAGNYRNRASLWMKVGEGQKARQDVVKAEEIEAELERK